MADHCRGLDMTRLNTVYCPEKRPELQQGFVPLGGRFRIFYDTATGKKPRFVFVQECATYRNCKLPIPLQIEPAHRCRIQPSVELFNFAPVENSLLFVIYHEAWCGMDRAD